MQTKVRDMTKDECRLWIMEQKCRSNPCLGSGTYNESFKCKGWGVAFPWASLPCPGETDSWIDHDYDVDVGDDVDGHTIYHNIGPVEISPESICRGTGCLQCGGSGRVLADITEGDLMKALPGHWYFRVTEFADGYLWRCGNEFFKAPEATGDSPLEAALRAFVVSEMDRTVSDEPQQQSDN